MSMISEELRDKAYIYPQVAPLLRNAADTIEVLSEKAREPKQGEWISNHDGYWICSECGLRVLIYAKGNYCPNCGAKMKGAKDTE